MTASLWKPGTIVADSIAEAVSVDQYFTATAGQTLFPITNFVYTPGAGTLQVFRNGALLTIGTDYSETSSSSITLTSGAAVGDRIACILSAALSFSTGTPASYAAAAKAAADSAAYSVSLINNLATKAGLQNQSYSFSAATGTVNAWIVTLSPVPTLTTGLRVTASQAAGNNTSTAPTLNVNGLGAKTIVKRDSAGTVSTLAIGDLRKNCIYDFIYNGTAFEVLGVVPLPTTVTFPELDIIRQQLLGVI